MTKEQFINDKNVSGFIQWFQSKLSAFSYSYYMRREKMDWQCISFYDACEKYRWAGCGWKETQTRINNLSVRLRKSICDTDDIACQEVCSEILKWGGVSRGNQEKIEEINHEEGLTAYLKKAKDLLSRNFIENIDYGIVMNSGFTKIYALCMDDFVIYDSRVGAALCYLVKLYCKRQKLDAIPLILSFAYGMSRNAKVNRNPNEGPYRFPTLGRDKIHIECNMKANWLLKEVINFPECLFKDLRSLEAALFMIGYEIPKK